MKLSNGSTSASRLALLTLAIGVLVTAQRSRQPVAPSMVSAANAFLNSLYPEQRQRATFKFDEDERLNWFYTPVPRKGLALREMTSGQRQLALALLNAGLSSRGFIKTTTIMSLDEVLASMESGLPILEKEASAQGFAAVQALKQMVEKAKELLPRE